MAMWCVCGRGVGSNLVQYTSCQKRVHKKCSGIKSSMSKVMSLICRDCLNPLTGTGCTSVWSMKWRVPGQEVDQRGLRERLCEKTVKLVN